MIVKSLHRAFSSGEKDMFGILVMNRMVNFGHWTHDQLSIGLGFGHLIIRPNDNTPILIYAYLTILPKWHYAHLTMHPFDNLTQSVLKGSESDKPVALG